MINKNILNHVCCLKCKGKLIVKNGSLYCKKCHKNYELIEKTIVEMLSRDIPKDVKLSLEKWNDLYKKNLQNKAYEAEKKEYDRRYLKDTLNQIFEYYHFRENNSYLEIGCGPMFLGQELAKRGLNVIGIDFSLPGLIIAKKMMEDKGIKNYLLIHGDIKDMPLKKNTIDIIYGGGVIEHFKKTDLIVAEMHRVLKGGGICFNTVPQLNLGTLTYRQIWGNIPDFPGLKQIAEFFHIRLLKGRHMKFGYEFSFTKKRIKKFFEKEGFSKVIVRDFKCYLPFEYLRPLWLKKIAREISKTEIFNPMVLIVAEK